ncbi:SusC/RagA family TonB-linked outer membrane protein [Sphingobacterium deserti]|uniref:TonB-dependent receptor plug n=1 Tax=Sphingobacterium deserti TaxID=1229276 RepID=A0A0B8SYU1_9SPHI|nr:TonB-dependent receptor [Sphingobacterium deserti]KGE12607.1 TonB-dependent receptor plug [Sphingobacterium deserti]
MNNRNLLFMIACFIATLFAGQASGQENLQSTVSGIVRDELEVALSGVTVHNRTTGETQVTGNQGDFKIKALRGDSIIFNFVGYKSYITRIGNITNLNITLEADNQSINEVVVVGFGAQKKISVVGAQSSVNIDDLKQPVANLSATLAGRIAGLVGVQRTGLPGGDGADLWIRGISTFNRSGNNAGPLVVVDGVQGRDINSFDPEDIASFSILKDAAATSVYGVAGANGVILITTKKGTTGKPTLMFNYNQGLTAFTRRPELTDGVTYMLLRNEAQRASGMTPEYSNNYINNTILGTDPYLYPNVNWMDALFNDMSDNKRANFSARGGSDFANYYVSGAYYDETALLNTDALQSYNASTRFKRYNFTSNVGMNWTKTTKFELGIQGYISNLNYPGVNPQDAFANVMQTNPVLYPVMYPGNFVPGVSSAGAQPNPYGQVTQTGTQNTFRNQIMSNARLIQDLSFWVPGLTFNALYSFDIWNSHRINRTRTRSTYLINRLFPYDAEGNPILNIISQGSDDLGFSRENDSNRQFYTEASLNYNTTIASDHSITAMLLYNQREEVRAFANSVTSSLPYRNQGIVGRLTYGYKDKYFFEGNFGYNGSENFAPGFKYGFFPSFGLGWVVSNEKFFAPLAETINFLKLRYSNGIVGDGGNGGRRFGYLTLVNTNVEGGGYTFGNGTNNVTYAGGAITDYGTDVRWAEAHKQNLGIEINTLNNKLSLVVDLFKERRSGVFLQRESLPNFVGLNSAPWGNLGIIENKGFDATLELNPFPIGNVFVDMRGTYTFNRDKVIENDMPRQPFPYMERRGVNYLSNFGYVADGLFQSQAEIDAHANQSALGQQRLGDIRYKDLNDDGIIDANDITRIGNGDVPNHIFGFGVNFTYKQFYIGGFFQGVSGAERLISGDGIIPFNNSTGAERSNLFAIAEDRWTEENPVANPFYPRLAYGNTANRNNAVASSWWIKDIDFIRLKTVDLGYNLPKSTAERFLLRNARVYLQGYNLLTWSSFKLWDPELNTSNGSRYPNIRTLTLGVQASF